MKPAAGYRPLAYSSPEAVQTTGTVALIDAYCTRFDEMMPGPIAGSVEILAELKALGKSLYGLANFSAETYPQTFERFEFLRWFRGILVSGEVGVIKPDPRIFELLLERFAIHPKRTVYIDDVAMNAEAARPVRHPRDPFHDAHRFARRARRTRATPLAKHVAVAMRATAVSLEIREASVFYGANRVLDRVSLSAAGSEFIALLGASGCGKTTLLRAICGFVGLASGSIVVGGQDVTRCPRKGGTSRWCSNHTPYGRI